MTWLVGATLLAMGCMPTSTPTATTAATASEASIRGWQNLTWGMTPAEAIEALGVAGEGLVEDAGQRPAQENGIAYGGIDIEVIGKPFSLILLFTQGDLRLYAVRLSLFTVDEISGANGHVFANLRRALAAKYNEPSVAGTKSHLGTAIGHTADMESDEWHFPETTIVLSHSTLAYRMGGVAMFGNDVRVEYLQVDKSVEGVL